MQQEEEGNDLSKGIRKPQILAKKAKGIHLLGVLCMFLWNIIECLSYNWEELRYISVVTESRTELGKSIYV